MHILTLVKITFSLLLGIIILSCTKSTGLPEDLKLAYYPIKPKAAYIYNTDSIVYDDFTGAKTSYTFDIKDTVISEMADGLNRKTFKIERYKRIGAGSWKFQRTFTRTLVEQRAEEFFDNQRFVRFTFPPKTGKTWNGNTYNNLGAQTYTLSELDVKTQINGISFDSTATVQEINEVNLIREDVVTSKYAKNIGLIYRQVKAIDKNISTGQIRKGYIHTLQLLSYK